ncbi:MAG: glutathione peroxidase [Janthinobacterium lividum]
MPDLKDIALRRIDGTSGSLADYADQVVLVVNVASKCGLTPQYESLEQAYTLYKADGFVVLGFPCNQFRDQEPGTEADIQEFCSTTYGVDFPLFSKIEVNGPGRHPLYEALIGSVPTAQEKPDGQMRERLAKHGIESRDGDVLWNFEKFLIGRNGKVAGRFAPDVGVDEQPLSQAIAAELGRSS